MPAPTPTPGACDAIVGAARQYCLQGTSQGAQGGGGSAPRLDDPATSLDPLTAFAQSVAKGAAWIVEKLAGSIDGIAAFDATREGFLVQYAVVFAASAFLTILLWLFAVAKRAMRGVPLTTAFGEAIGLLWFTVGASAFTPLVLHVVVGAVDAVTDALAGTDDGSAATLFKSMAAALRQGGENIGGGPIMLLIVAGLIILTAGALWLELALRGVALYVGAVLATIVYAGLVDRALWPKVRIWVGFMIALILVKPVIVISLSIASVFTAAEGPGSTPVIVAGLAVIILALLAGWQIFRFVPGYGDDIAIGLAHRATAGAARGAVRIAGGAAGVVAQGIRTHATRDTAAPKNQGGGNKSKAQGVSDGISTHGSRRGDKKSK
ncbi:hypothetical protein ABZ135_37310 [Streptomyces sp. NPDC006339]|uniref:hypothetical protein n=1 Tax=Streptomyces sp. NPDC006339 TaxID=3156755 RepID=UPI0033AE16DF